MIVWLQPLQGEGRGAFWADEQQGKEVALIRRYRQPRGVKAKDFVTVYGYNTTGTEQLVDFLDWLGSAERADFVVGRTFACLFQELKTLPQAWDLLRERVHRHKFFLVGTPAVTLNTGPSAGTGIAVPNGRAALSPPLPYHFDVATAQSRGRISVALADSNMFMVGGCLLITAYLHHNEPLWSERNFALLAQCVEVIRALGVIYIWQFDGQHIFYRF